MDATDRLLACPHDREMAVPWPFLANPNDSIETAVQNIGISGWPGLVENFSQSQSTKGLSKAELNLLAVPVVRIQRQAVVGSFPHICTPLSLTGHSLSASHS